MYTFGQDIAPLHMLPRTKDSTLKYSRKSMTWTSSLSTFSRDWNVTSLNTLLGRDCPCAQVMLDSCTSDSTR